MKITNAQKAWIVFIVLQKKNNGKFSFFENVLNGDIKINVLIKTELPWSDINIGRLNFRRFNDRKIFSLFSDSCRGIVWTCDGCYDAGSFTSIFNEAFRSYGCKYYSLILFAESTLLTFYKKTTQGPVLHFYTQ